MGFNIDDLSALLGESFVELGEYNGEHYGIPTNINLKSMVWYPKATFDAAGYTIPETWDDLIALSDQIVADGSTPWCVGFQSEGSTGWPATDWMEDIMLRTAGPEVYDQWRTHEIPFNDASVLNAIDTFGDVMFADGYVLGGADATPDIPFGDAPGPMFQDPPGCWLHRQASFIPAFFPTDAVAGEDYDWFPLPPIDQEGTLYAGELTVVGTAGNRAEVKDFLDQFLDQEVQCAMGGVQASSRISPNVEVGADCYVNDILADASVNPDGFARVGHGALRRLGPDAGGGRERDVLERHGRLHEERTGQRTDGPRRHRGQLARLRAKGLRSAEVPEGAAAQRPLPPSDDGRLATA